MSLILDALKKLERDQARRDSDVVVVGALPWEGVRPRRAPALLAASALLLVGALTAIGWLWRHEPAGVPAAAAPRAAQAPQTAPAPQASAPPAALSPPRAVDESAAPPPRRFELPRPTPPGTVPTARTSSRAAPAEELRLEAISERDGRPLAMINDHLLFEGDSFDGVRVVRIGAAEVEIEVRGERRVLRF